MFRITLYITSLIWILFTPLCSAMGENSPREKIEEYIKLLNTKNLKKLQYNNPNIIQFLIDQISKQNKQISKQNKQMSKQKKQIGNLEKMVQTLTERVKHPFNMHTLTITETIRMKKKEQHPSKFNIKVF